MSKKNVWNDIVSIGRRTGGIGVFAARAYVNYKYPGAKSAWHEYGDAYSIPYVTTFLDWFFKVK